MRIFRISKAEYIEDISGTGAKRFGGRWNEKGTGLLYCSENISLAILEILVHFDGLTVPDNLMILELELEEKYIQDFSRTQFDKICLAKDAEYLFKKAGQKWIKSQKSLALKVPSIINTFEYNIIVNPTHPDFKNVKKKSCRKLELDDRLFI